MANKRELTNDNVYGAIERQLRDENFKVKHLMRDSRGDWADDGGWLISISEKNDKIYLHVIGVNYNSSVGVNVLDEMDYRIVEDGQDENKIADYIICESIADAQEKLNAFVVLVERAYEMIENDESYFFENGYFERAEDVPYGFVGLDSYYLSMISHCWFSMSEYTNDADKLRNLTNIEYVPDYTDPEEYTED
jgi:hypothetical protein